MRSLRPLSVVFALLGIGGVIADEPFFNDLVAYNQELLGQYPNQTFHSTRIVAPLFQVNTFHRDLVDDSGYIFMTCDYAGKGGPAIFSAKDLSLVYADFTYNRSFDARAQVRQNEKYLTFFEGGNCHVFDDAYEKRWTVTAKGLGRTRADLHEFQFTDDGTAIMSVYEDLKFNLSALGGPEDGMLSDGVFQEVDLETNNVLVMWRASIHFSLTDTYVEYDPANTFMEGQGFDWFHINSIFKNKDGNYLISSRGLSMIALVDGETGDPLWVLGGKRNKFKDLSGGNATNFRHQHQPRYVNGNMSQISFFDNHVRHSGLCGQEGKRNCSRGVVLELDYNAMTAKLLHEFYHPQHVSSQAEGSMQALENGNFLVGWGINPAFTEHLPNGTVAMDVQRGALPNVGGAEPDINLTVYRAWKMDWVGRPLWGPDVAAESTGNTTANATIYVSWNGNTEIASWEVYAGDDENSITMDDTLVGNSTRNGFETVITLKGHVPVPRYARVAALTKDGTIQGLTKSVDLLTGRQYGESSSIWNSTTYGSEPEDSDLDGFRGGAKGEQSFAACYDISLGYAAMLAVAVMTLHLR